MNTLKFGNSEWYGSEGNILAYNDENGNFKPLPFDFSRGSIATRVNQQGLIETVGANNARVDYLDNANGALKLEPTRTNLITYSEDYSQWSTTSSSVIANSAISPDGTQNAYKFIDTTSNSFHYLKHPATSAQPSTNYTASYFVKADGINFFQIVGSTGSEGAGYVNFDLINGTVGDSDSITGSIKDCGNGWFRCIGTNVSTATASEIRLLPFLITSTSSPRAESYIGDGSGIFIFGAQLEQGSYATSYIPTQGAAQTRLRDLSDTENLSHVIGQTEGVIFYDAILVHKSTDTSEDLFELSIDDGSNQNIFFINNYNNTLIVGFNNGGSNQFYSNSYNPTEGARYKLAFAYKQNDFALYINGNQIATDSSGTVPAMNQITFGNYYNNQFNLSNIVKVNNLKFYNTRLSNSELATLTQV